MRMRKVGWAVDYLDQAGCLVRDPSVPGTWKREGRLLHLEIGTGKGGYSLDMARQYPDRDFVAVEKNETAAGMAAKKYDEADLANLSLIHGDARFVSDWFGPKEVDVIHLNFSDPWPKKRNAKRRLSADSFLNQYETILSASGTVVQKTDNSSLFEYSVLQFLQAGWQLEEISVDWRRQAHPEDAMSEYEAKFVESGQPIYRAVWRKPCGK